ncbi:MFS transporter [Tsukamurella sputi]|uniref:MFS transporter n=1 Tax=Tsukamurella sputi TaxID=2591848 RepID=A0A5C5RNV9_9ACTN|nr:MFS transporter [Tsukamurella sputi]TWS24294.1 MFS transporter [Tsukamurella sputi]
MKSTGLVGLTDMPARKGFLTRLLVACCGGPFLDGYVMSIIGVALIGVNAEMHPSNVEIGLIGAAALIGIFFGSAVFGCLTDRLGREKMYAIDLTVLVGACALSVFVTAPWQLIVLRFVIGAAIGADYPIATSLLTEFTPSKRRGMMVGASALAWSLGAVAAYVVGAIVIAATGSTSHWRWLLASAAILGVIVVLLRRGIPESPRWLLQNGRAEEARAVAREIYDVDLDVHAPVPVSAEGKANLRSLLRGLYGRRLLMCSALYLAVVTPLYALLMFLPRILDGFGISGDGASGLIVETVIIGLIAAGSVPAMFLVERWGRRPLTVVPLAIMVFPLLGLWLWADAPLWFVVVAFCVYAFISGGPSILVWIYPSELFPTEIRASASGLVTAISRFGAATGTYLLPMSIAGLGTPTTMMFGAVLTGVAFVVCLALAPETKGRSLDAASSGEFPAQARPAPQKESKEAPKGAHGAASNDAQGAAA